MKLVNSIRAATSSPVTGESTTTTTTRIVPGLSMWIALITSITSFNKRIPKCSNKWLQLSHPTCSGPDSSPSTNNSTSRCISNYPANLAKNLSVYRLKSLVRSASKQVIAHLNASTKIRDSIPSSASQSTKSKLSVTRAIWSLKSEKEIKNLRPRKNNKSKKFKASQKPQYPQSLNRQSLKNNKDRSCVLSPYITWRYSCWWSPKCNQ